MRAVAAMGRGVCPGALPSRLPRPVEAPSYELMNDVRARHPYRTEAQPRVSKKYYVRTALVRKTIYHEFFITS